jgi:hypothetical protein
MKKSAHIWKWESYLFVRRWCMVGLAENGKLYESLQIVWDYQIKLRSGLIGLQTLIFSTFSTINNTKC